MPLEILAISIQITLLSFLIGLPMRKRRPIVVRSFLAALIILFCFSLFALLWRYLYLYAIGIFLAIAIYYIKPPWVVFGVTREQLKTSYEKSLIMTRSPSSTTLIFLATFAKISIVSVPRKLGKKRKLVENLYRKLIENQTVSYYSKGRTHDTI